jgi:hypothetical protein
LAADAFANRKRKYYKNILLSASGWRKILSFNIAKNLLTIVLQKGYDKKCLFRRHKFNSKTPLSSISKENSKINRTKGDHREVSEVFREKFRNVFIEPADFFGSRHGAGQEQQKDDHHHR